MSKKYLIPPFPQAKDALAFLNLLQNEKELEKLMEWLKRVTEIEANMLKAAEDMLQGKTAEGLVNEAQELRNTAKRAADLQATELEATYKKLEKYSEEQSKFIGDALGDLSERTLALDSDIAELHEQRQSNEVANVAQLEDIRIANEDLVAGRKRVEAREKTVEATLKRLKEAGIVLES